MFGFSFGDILYDDRIWQNFLFMRSRTIINEFEIYIKYFPPGNNKEVK